MNPTVEQLLAWIADGTPPPGSYEPTTLERMLWPVTP